MANLFSQLINNRFIQPAIADGVEKALSAHHPPAYGVGTVPETPLAKAIGRPHDADYALLYALYKLNTDVSGCVHKWAGGVTGAGWRITTMDPDATLSPALEKEMQNIERWMRNPNPYKLFESMLYEGVQHFGITGDYYWYITQDKQGRPLEIWPMHPALTKIVATKQGEVLGYVMKAPGEDPLVFTADEVLHFPLPNPTNDLYGESPLELVIEEAGIDLQALRSNKAIFQNGLNPSAVLLMDENAKREDAQAMTDMLKQSHTGSGNQHKIVALSKTKEFKPWTMTNRDLEFLKLRDLATSKVTTAYRIPKVLLGHHNAGDYATTKFLIRDTYNHVYRPMQRIIESIITERLIHRFNPELRFELLTPDASDPDDIRKDQMQAKRDGILTSDEVRGDAFGKEALDKDVVEDTPTTNEQKPDKDAGDTAEDAPDANKSTSADSRGDARVTKAVSNKESELLERREAALDALAQPVESPVIGYFDRQEASYIQRLADFNPGSVSKALTDENLDGYIEGEAETFDLLLHSLLTALLYPSLSAGVATAQLQVNISLGFNQTNPLVQDYLNTQVLDHAKGINQTTKNQLRLALSEGLQGGESINQLSKRVENVFAEAKGYRANLIARNETNQAYQYANHETLEVMHQQGVVDRRRWLTAGDSRVRPTHAELNGYTIRFDARYPGDIEPGQEINCRCTEIGLIPDEGALT